MPSSALSAAAYLALSADARDVVRDAASADPALTTSQAVQIAVLLGGAR